jgi:CheY-like chemotaxis protein
VCAPDEDDSADAFAAERFVASSACQRLTGCSMREAEHAVRWFSPAVIVTSLLLEHDEARRPSPRRREIATGPDIPPMVVCSTNGSRDTRNSGADEYAAKPIQGGYLPEMLDRVTDKDSDTRMLLVDDEEVTRDPVRQLVPHSRYSVRAARADQEGLQQLGAARRDLIVVDLNMPEMDGDEIVRRLWDVSVAAGIPAVALAPAHPPANLAETEPIPLHSVSRIVSEGEPTATHVVDLIDRVLRQTAAAGAR